ncbi:MAG: dihydropteroate synthase, partial [Gemmatimonadaceae bacterium]
FLSHTTAVERAEEMLSAGADSVEIGGESTRPGATPVDVHEEIGRVVPVIRELRARHPLLRIAIDTVKAETAAAALRAGATTVNDVSALRLDARMAAVCAAAGCTVVLMHSRGDIADMARYSHADYGGRDVMDVVLDELAPAIDRALEAGVNRASIIVDPGIGFAKMSEHSVQALAQLPRLVELGFPVMVGASRKRFIGEITGVRKAADRDAGSVGASVVALTLGATWFRVHDVRSHRHALDVAATVLEVRA